MANFLKKLLGLGVLLLLSLGLIAVLWSKPIIPTRTARKEVFGLPAKLIIPLIGVEAKVQYLGVNAKGEMEVPDSIIDVGWFKLGSKPGEKGSAVMAGHLNGVGGKAGVFANLNKLKTGDILKIVDDNGQKLTFVVKKINIYDLGYVDEVFSRSDGIYLNLITCDGVWDEAKKSYDKRLVVFTELFN